MPQSEYSDPCVDLARHKRAACSRCAAISAHWWVSGQAHSPAFPVAGASCWPCPAAMFAHQWSPIYCFVQWWSHLNLSRQGKKLRERTHVLAAVMMWVVTEMESTKWATSSASMPKYSSSLVVALLGGLSGLLVLDGEKVDTRWRNQNCCKYWKSLMGNKGCSYNSQIFSGLFRGLYLQYPHLPFTWITMHSSTSFVFYIQWILIYVIDIMSHQVFILR